MFKEIKRADGTIIGDATMSVLVASDYSDDIYSADLVFGYKRTYTSTGGAVTTITERTQGNAKSIEINDGYAQSKTAQSPGTYSIAIVNDRGVTIFVEDPNGSTKLEINQPTYGGIKIDGNTGLTTYIDVVTDVDFVNQTTSKVRLTFHKGIVIGVTAL